MFSSCVFFQEKFDWLKNWRVRTPFSLLLMMVKEKILDFDHLCVYNN